MWQELLKSLVTEHLMAIIKSLQTDSEKITIVIEAFHFRQKCVCQISFQTQGHFNVYFHSFFKITGESLGAVVITRSRRHVTAPHLPKHSHVPNSLCITLTKDQRLPRFVRISSEELQIWFFSMTMWLCGYAALFLLFRSEIIDPLNKYVTVIFTYIFFFQLVSHNFLWSLSVNTQKGLHKN